MHWLSFFIGALLGWLICWLIDFLFCRRRRMAIETRLQSKLKVCTEENAALQAQLAAYQGGPTRSAGVDAELEDLRARAGEIPALLARLDGANAEIGALKARLADASEAQAQLSAAQIELEALRGRLADMDDLRADVRGWEARAEQQRLEIERLQAELAASAATRAPASALAGLAAASARTGGRDDLTAIEGIGPKINDLLAEAGIVTFAQLAETSVERLREILAAAGPRYALADPATWPQQAALARDGQWEAFQALLDSLKGGRAV